jgi:flagellar biosynthesis protein FlhF
MTVKTYSAPSMQAAMTQVKQDFGEDALIISTRRIPKPPMDPYGKDTFQVQASAAPVSSTPRRHRPKTRLSDQEILSMTAGVTGKEPLPAPKRQLAGDGMSGYGIGDIREILWWSGFNEDMLELMDQNKDAFKVYSKLLLSGISEKRIKSLLKSGLSPDSPDEEDFTLRVLKSLVASVETKDPFADRPRKGQRAIAAAFIGPTGVGKTTTIAKLAAELSLKRKKRVGLISVDNYRIGAVDQLKTYASIIGLPCIPAFSQEDLEKALGKLSGMDYVLIDTAGQSHLDAGRMQKLKKTICSVPGISKHLVLSASMGRLDMKETVSCFDLLEPSTYVFSKVDETNRCGRIVDQMMDHRMPLSFITNGQEVPEDLIVASPKHVLQLLLYPESFRS